MDEPSERSLNRLRKLAEESDGAMAVPEIIAAVTDVDVDKEIVDLVKLAFESNEKPMSLEEIARGVSELILWREENC